MRYFQQLIFFVFLISPSIDFANAETFKAPKCLAGLCLDAKLPLENNIRSHFGGHKKREFKNDFSYCYKFIEKNKKISYGYFLFKSAVNKGLVTIKLSRTKICEGATVKVSGDTLVTEKGLRLGSSKDDTLKLYGTPNNELRPAAEDLLSDFFGKNSINKADKIFQYLDNANASYPNTRFYYLNNEIVGIELSIDE